MFYNIKKNPELQILYTWLQTWNGYGSVSSLQYYAVRKCTNVFADFFFQNFIICNKTISLKGGLEDRDRVRCWELTLSWRRERPYYMWQLENLRCNLSNLCLGKNFASLDRLSNSCPLLFALALSSTLSCSEADHLTCWHMRRGAYTPTLL